MSVSSKLTNSVRQVKAANSDDNKTDVATTEPEQPTEVATMQTEPPVAPAPVRRRLEEEAPLPPMSSRRVWPD